MNSKKTCPHGGKNFKPIRGADQTPLVQAIRKSFPHSDPSYWLMIARRYRELYEGSTEEEAVHAVLQGHSSPSAAMRARVIRKRKYIGFMEDLS